MKPITILANYNSSFTPCLVTRLSITGIDIRLNNTIFKCISKRQDTVETSICGAELVAARLCVE